MWNPKPFLMREAKSFLEPLLRDEEVGKLYDEKVEEWTEAADIEKYEDRIFWRISEKKPEISGLFFYIAPERAREERHKIRGALQRGTRVRLFSQIGCFETGEKQKYSLSAEQRKRRQR